jgi:hypothetical protein
MGALARERRQAPRDAVSPLEGYLHAYLDGAGIGDDTKSPLFRTIRRGTGRLSTTALPQANAYAMVRRRALAAAIDTKIGNHTFRATGITAFLKNGGTLENGKRLTWAVRTSARACGTMASRSC